MTLDLKAAEFTFQSLSRFPSPSPPFTTVGRTVSSLAGGRASVVPEAPPVTVSITNYTEGPSR
jgi:hypothetical protein